MGVEAGGFGTNSTMMPCRLISLQIGHDPAVGGQTAGIDPKLPSKIGLRNGREGRESGLSLKA
jgi:hypothetical protein